MAKQKNPETVLIHERFQQLADGGLIDATTKKPDALAAFDIAAMKKKKGCRNITENQIAYQWGVFKNANGWINSRNVKRKKPDRSIEKMSYAQMKKITVPNIDEKMTLGEMLHVKQFADSIGGFERLQVAMNAIRQFNEDGLI